MVISETNIHFLIEEIKNNLPDLMEISFSPKNEQRNVICLKIIYKQGDKKKTLQFELKFINLSTDYVYIYYYGEDGLGNVGGHDNEEGFLDKIPSPESGDIFEVIRQKIA